MAGATQRSRFKPSSADGGLTADEDGLSIVVSGVTRDFDFDLTFGPSEASFIALNDANSGDSILFFGGDRDDEFRGGSGDDFLDGGGGDDLLIGGDGADILIGGAGQDIFGIGPSDSASILEPADVITDFEDGVDWIGLEGGLRFDDLQIRNNGGSGTTISIQATGEILAIVEGINAHQLDSSDFVGLA